MLDPFCGSGTTGIEACRLGRRALLSDRITGCVAIAKAKVCLMRGGFSRELRDTVLSELTFDHTCRTTDLGCNGEGGDPELELWFTPDTLAQLRYLWKIVSRYEPNEAGALWTIFSDVLFTCASTRGSTTRTGRLRRHHWGWVADNVRPTSLIDHDAVRLYRDRIALLEVMPSSTNFVNCEVVQEDARSLALLDNSVDLVVTSPPYLAMIDYVHAQRLLYLWMGWSIKDDRGHEIGARYRRNRLMARSEYLQGMAECAAEIARVLRPGGHCAMVVGTSQKFPGTASEVLQLFSKDLINVWGPLERSPSRRRLSSRSGKPPVELVSVLVKP